jgi:hypothetical protein
MTKTNAGLPKIAIFLERPVNLHFEHPFGKKRTSVSDISA